MFALESLSSREIIEVKIRWHAQNRRTGEENLAWWCCTEHRLQIAGMPASGRTRVEFQDCSPSPVGDLEYSTAGEESFEDDSDSEVCPLPAAVRCMHLTGTWSLHLCFAQVGSSHERTFEEQEQARKEGVRHGRHKPLQDDDSGRWPLKVKRASKNEPQVLSSKYPVPRHREALQVPKRCLPFPWLFWLD